MIEILRKREVKNVVEHYLTFDWPDGDGGFSFECDAAGKVNEAGWATAGRVSLGACRTGRVNGKPIGQGYVERVERRVVEPAVGRCTCGREITLEGDMAIVCRRCGATYNVFGQELKPVDEWFGEDGRTLDTGETYHEVFADGGPTVV